MKWPSWNAGTAAAGNGDNPEKDLRKAGKQEIFKGRLFSTLSSFPAFLGEFSLSFGILDSSFYHRIEHSVKYVTIFP